MRLKRRIVGRTSESNCSVSSAFEIRRELDFRDRNLSWNRDHPLNSFSIIQGNPIVVLLSARIVNH